MNLIYMQHKTSLTVSTKRVKTKLIFHTFVIVCLKYSLMEKNVNYFLEETNTQPQSNILIVEVGTLHVKIIKTCGLYILDPPPLVCNRCLPIA